MKTKNLIQEAVKDAEAIRKAATEAAKNEILGKLAPSVKKLVDEKINSLSESKLRNSGTVKENFEGGLDKGDSDMKDKEDKDLDLESTLAGFFPQLSEVEEELPEMAEMPPEDKMEMESEIPTLGEGEDAEEGDLEETIELSTEELAKVYESLLQTEAQVTKGFADVTKAGEEIDPAAGLADVKKGEHNWDEEEPPAKQDFTVKEMIRRGMKENKVLRTNFNKALTVIEHLKKKLHEVNLFNSKVLHVNQILNRHGRLTAEQRQVVMQSIDKGKSIAEVKSISEAIKQTLEVSRLSESRKPKANAQRVRTKGVADQEVLRESADRSQGNDAFARMKILAGITK